MVPQAKTKVRFVIADLGPGGAQTVTLQQVQLLRSAGYDAELVVLNGHIKDNLVTKCAFYLRFNTWKVLRIIRQIIWLKQNLSSGVTVFCVMEYASVLSWLAGLKFKSIFHSDLNWKYSNVKRWLLLFLMGRRNNLASYVLTDEIKNGLGESSRRLIEILPNPLPILKDGPSDEKHNVIFVGRLEAVKDPERALRLFISSGLGEVCNFIVVGDGSLKSYLQEICRDAGALEYVKFIGWSTEAPHLIGQARMLLVSSQSEAFPNVVLEAFMSKTLVFACSNTSGYRALLKNGRGIWAIDESCSSNSRKLFDAYTNISNYESCFEAVNDFLDQKQKTSYLENLTEKLGI